MGQMKSCRSSSWQEILARQADSAIMISINDLYESILVYPALAQESGRLFVKIRLTGIIDITSGWNVDGHPLPRTSE
jgi:pantothenate kinase-related protein Tda10